MTWVIIIAALIVFFIAVVIANIKIVPQSKAYVVERLGAYKETWQTGLHIKIPFIEKVSKIVSLKEKVADFSFLMSLPVIGGAALLELIDVFQTGAYAGVDWLCVALGMVAAFVSGLFAIKLMLALIKKVNYKYFSIYLAVLSIVLMVLQFVGS